MSRDIRSFFSLGKKTTKPLPSKIDEDDDDVIPQSPNVQIIKKRKESRKRRVLSDESDEEIITTKKKKPSTEKSLLTQSTSKNKSPKKSLLKEVKAIDIFGGPIKRTEPLVSKKKKATETGIHSDDDFEKSLLELDEVEILHSDEKVTVTNSLTNDIGLAEPKNDVNNVLQKNGCNTESMENSKLESKQSHLNESKKEILNANQRSEEKRRKKRKIEETLDERKKDNTGLGSKKKINNTDFSQFVGDDSVIEEDDESKNKKKKNNKSLNESALTDEERHERRMHSIMLYKSYLNRSGPKNLGAKVIPEGKKDCLKDCAFLLTGVLESFEREDICNAITKYGGSVKNSISKKVTHVLAGEDAGPAKTAKAQELGIKIINEDEFLKMIKDKSKGQSGHSNQKQDGNDVKKEISKERSHNRKSSKHRDKNHDESKEGRSDSKASKQNHDVIKHKQSEVKTEKVTPQFKIKSETKCNNTEKHKVNEEEIKPVNKEVEMKKEINDIISLPKESKLFGGSSMWVEKYKPQSLKQIIGQHGDNSHVKKLINWLSKWYINRKTKLPKPSPWAKNDDGGYFKAALLSGPPGVGKTTTVTLVCKELGFDAVEFNASDTRNKTLIKQQIGELLTTTSLSGYAKGEVGKQAVSKKHVLVMDEVDGMAGNEDRGGMQELIALIKSTSVPIICMCNDRQSQKMRSLVNYVYELKFARPNINQIKAAMLSICSKESVKIPQDVLTQLITAANRDVRQTLNLLSMWAVDSAPDHDSLKRDVARVKRDIKLGPWEAVHKVFTAEDHKTMSLNDKSDLFFYDYSLSPLFVQENYLSVEPHCPKKEILDRVSRAADSISAGDMVEARIRGKQAWSLLPLQAMYSSVIPGHAMSGHITKMINFPSWLGKNSRTNKMHRLCQEIHAHTRLSTSGSKSSIFLDYCSHLRDAIVTPLVKDRSEGIPATMHVLESYHLLREDLDSLTELSLWPGQRNPMVLIDSKVKSAMTRTYNKNATALPYAPAAIKKGRARHADDGDDEHYGDDGNGDGDDDIDDEDSDPEADALIKKKKTKEPEQRQNQAKIKERRNKVICNQSVKLCNSL